MTTFESNTVHRTNLAISTPILLSHSWDELHTSFNRYAKVMDAASLYAGALAVRSKDAEKKAIFGVAALAAKGTAMVAKEAAEFAATQALEAKRREEALSAEASLRAEQARRDLERWRAETKRERDFSQQLAVEEGRYHERVEGGKFLHEYRDPPTREKLERAGRLA